MRVPLFFGESSFDFLFVVVLFFYQESNLRNTFDQYKFTSISQHKDIFFPLLFVELGICIC